MSNISLTQITSFVIAVSLVSFLVDANDELVMIKDKAAVSVETPVDGKAMEALSEQSDKFTFTSLDTDENGMLSREEVVEGKNEWLVKSFAEIDSNTDESLTEQELVDFVTKNVAETKVEE